MLALCAWGCAPAKPATPPGTLPARPALVSETPGAASRTVSNEAVHPCVPDTRDAREAEGAIERLDAEIANLAANASGVAIRDAILQLLEGPCFALATVPVPFELDSGLAAKEWWQAGGKWWLENQLALGGSDHELVFPPSGRATLVSDRQKGHPLAPLLCPADAALPDARAGCGRETLGWMHRARLAFAKYAEAKRAEELDMRPPPARRDECEAVAKAASPHEALRAYSECMERTMLPRDALPIGRFAAPKQGWLVLRGRHADCDEIRAYDLETGSVYIARECGGAKTRQRSVESGRVPVDALREAALFTLLASSAEHDVVLQGGGWWIPSFVPIELPERTGAEMRLHGISTSSGRTVLEVSWILGGRGQARTSLDWPDSSEPAKAHAAELLAIAELGFVSGCAPARLATLPWTALGPRLDEHEYLPTFDGDPTYDALRAAIEGLRTRPACGARE